MTYGTNRRTNLFLYHAMILLELYSMVRVEKYNPMPDTKKKTITPICPSPNMELRWKGRQTPFAGAWHIKIPIVARPMSADLYFENWCKSKKLSFMFQSFYFAAFENIFLVGRNNYIQGWNCWYLFPYEITAKPFNGICHHLTWTQSEEFHLPAECQPVSSKILKMVPSFETFHHVGSSAEVSHSQYILQQKFAVSACPLCRGVQGNYTLVQSQIVFANPGNGGHGTFDGQLVDSLDKQSLVNFLFTRLPQTYPVTHMANANSFLLTVMP